MATFISVEMFAILGFVFECLFGCKVCLWNHYIRTISSPKNNETILSYRRDIELVNQWPNSMPPNIYSDHPQKTKVTHIAFLKVRKCGSCTISSVLDRFALTYDLRLAIPKQGEYLNRKEDAILVNGTTSFDIFSVHTINYNEELFGQILPLDRKDIAIVREPVSRLISAAFYYLPFAHTDPNCQYLARIPKQDYIHHLLMHPDVYEQYMFSLTRNAMAFDLGFTDSDWGLNDNEIKTRLKLLDDKIAIVLVLERLDESLVLMKRMFNWNLKDIVNTWHNKNNEKSETLLTFNQTELDTFRKFNRFDVAVYEFFSGALKQKIQNAGDDFQLEVDCFRNIKHRILKFCSSIHEHFNRSLQIEQNRWNEAFKFSTDECSLLNSATTRAFEKYLKSIGKT
ncbi:hypothetical protein DPMN_008206 [Dreissena polymorpha]|uniref:Uncharacterized protein n=1 Tax=Dreissena polymorpha TaxID=45954 RepID=A0A9D4MYC7_DREPO|nr:hypothetical protein DPMN_008206 [Dreissena polymorpha]